MDPKSLENEAQSAIAAAATLEELDAVRVRYLGRKSDLKRALREVRDRESGMSLNTVRERLETAVAARENQLRRRELDRALHEEQVDITLPGEPFPRGHLHLVTQIRREVEDVFLGLGYQIYDGREVEDVFRGFAPPLPGAALVVGGTARALRKLVGPTLGPDELAQAVSELSSRSHSAIARRHGVDRRRTPLLLGGALILSEVQRRLVVPLEVVGAGLREGALVRSLDAVAA